jgi:hypothetical protein
MVALIGAKGLWLLYLWLASSIAASHISGRKGYGERIGLAFGLFLSALGVVVWLLWPARPGSTWRTEGALPRMRRRRL